MKNRFSSAAGLFLLFLILSPPLSRAQLVGADTAPGSSCSGFPAGATRLTADADQDGANVTLVCDGSIWNAASGDSVSPLSADLDLAGHNILGGGSAQLGYDTGTCDNNRLGIIRYDSASKAFSICRDSNIGWEPVAGAGAGGVCNTEQVYTGPGTYTYTVPDDFGTITIKLWSGGGGGGASSLNSYNGGAGGVSSIVSRGLLATGGAGNSGASGGAGGTASGGDINLPGSNGLNGSGTNGNKGGNAPGVGGGTGGSGSSISNATDGSPPGGGGGGANGAGGGGSGAYVEKVYTQATLAPGTLINDIVVGDKGPRGTWTYKGGYGGYGQVTVSCSTTGAGNYGGVLVGYQASCSTSDEGTIRYASSGTPSWEYCDGSVWSPFEHAGLAGPAGCANIGDLCADGTVFAGYHPTTHDHLFIPTTDQGTTSAWKTSTGVNDIATDSFIDGRANTNQVANSATFPAFKLCKDLATGGHSDWYLPSRAELDYLYNMRAALVAAGNITDFQNVYYWSSTEYNTTNAWSQNFTDGYVATTKTLAFRVRCVRR